MFGRKKNIVTLKHVAAPILWFLLQLKVIPCTFLKKNELQIKKNKLILCFFNNTKIHKMLQNHNKK